MSPIISSSLSMDNDSEIDQMNEGFSLVTEKNFSHSHFPSLSEDFAPKLAEIKQRMQESTIKRVNSIRETKCALLEHTVRREVFLKAHLSESSFSSCGLPCSAH